MTPPLDAVGTNCFAVLTGKFAKLLMPVSRQQLQRVGSRHEEVHHVVRLVEEHGGLAPRLLLATPVRELGRHDGVDVGSELRVAQVLDGVPRLIEHFLQVAGHVVPFNVFVVWS